MDNTKDPMAGTVEARDKRLLDELAQELQNLDVTKNKVRLTEFLEYQALFSAEMSKPLSRTDIQLLSTRFSRRFNVYSAIEVYDDNGIDLLFKVPQLFVPIKDVDHKYINAVNKFRSDGVSDIPRYASEAVGGLVSAIMKSQTDVAEKGFATYGDYIKSLTHEYQVDKDSFPKNETKTDDSDSHEEIGLSDPGDVPGLSWE